MIDKNRGCLRFYGDEENAFYAAHLHKDMDSLDEDNILSLLTYETSVMHDHNKVNYNEKYCFKNLECIQHLQRDIHKNTDDIGHEESEKLKNLIKEKIAERKELIAEGINGFEENYIEAFRKRVYDILNRLEKRNQEENNMYSGPFERNLIKHIRECFDEYFAWMYDFSLPTTNNLSEQGYVLLNFMQRILDNLNR